MLFFVLVYVYLVNVADNKEYPIVVKARENYNAKAVQIQRIVD